MAQISFFLHGVVEVIINIITISESQWATEDGALLYHSSSVAYLCEKRIDCYSKCLSIRYYASYTGLSAGLLCVSSPLLCILWVTCMCVCMRVCASTWMCLNLLLFTPIVQLCLGELLWSNWMSRGRGKPAAANVYPLALLSIIRQPLCLRFVVFSWIQKWIWWTSEVNTEGRDRPERF